jgi:small-conductance mechanosensitive channel
VKPLQMSVSFFGADSQPVSLQKTTGKGEIMNEIRSILEAIRVGGPIAWFAIPTLGIAFGIVVYFFLKSSLRFMMRRMRISEESGRGAYGILRWTVGVITALLVLQLLGVPIGSVWTVVSALLAMVAIGFVAVWSILSNISSSLLIHVLDPFEKGDEIEIIEPTGGNGLAGKVVDIRVMYTVLNTTDENGQRYVVHVPNNTFFQKTVKKKVAAPGGGPSKNMIV